MSRSLLTDELGFISDVEAFLEKTKKNEWSEIQARRIFLEHLTQQKRNKNVRILSDGVDIPALIFLMLTDFMLFLEFLGGILPFAAFLFPLAPLIFFYIAISILFITSFFSLYNVIKRKDLLRSDSASSGPIEQAKNNQLEKNYILKCLMEMDSAPAHELNTAYRAVYNKRLRKLILPKEQYDTYFSGEVRNQNVRLACFFAVPAVVSVLIGIGVSLGIIGIATAVPFLSGLLVFMSGWTCYWYWRKAVDANDRKEKLLIAHGDEIKQLNNEVLETQNLIEQITNFKSTGPYNTSINQAELDGKLKLLQERKIELEQKIVQRQKEHLYEIACMDHWITEREYKCKAFALIFAISVIATVVSTLFIFYSVPALALVATVLTAYAIYRLGFFLRDNRIENTKLEKTFEMEDAKSKSTSGPKPSTSAGITPPPPPKPTPIWHAIKCMVYSGRDEGFPLSPPRVLTSSFAP